MIIPSPRSQKRARIEIVPLIDIVFFLLATFVMVSLSMVKNQGLPVSLPVATNSANQSKEEFTTITVTAAGEYFLNKQAMTLSEIASRFSEIKSQIAEPKVFITGDAHAELQAVVSVLDEIRKLGISKVAIGTTSVKP